VTAGIVATLAGGAFAGAALYISLVEHPARLECGAAIAVSEFRPSYRRAAVMQASLAGVGALAALVAWWSSARGGWLVGGLLLGSVIPFTLVVVLPTNRRLLDPTLDAASTEAANLLARWGRLHALRTAASTAAFTLFVLLSSS
jgi:uncharacterized membrane protein